MILKHLVPTFYRDQTAGAASPVKTSDQTIGTHRYTKQLQAT